MRDHINIIPSGDYLARHNGISKNFYKMFPYYKLPAAAYDNKEGIQKTYNSICKHYNYLEENNEKNNTANTKPIRQARQFHI